MYVEASRLYGLGQPLFDSTLSYRYRETVLPLYLQLHQQIHKWLAELTSFVKDVTHRIQGPTAFSAINEDILVSRSELLLSDWKNILDESWRTLFDSFEKEVYSNCNLMEAHSGRPTQAADMPNQEKSQTAALAKTDSDFGRQSRMVELNAKLVADSYHSYLGTAAQELIKSSLVQLEQKDLKYTDGDDNNDHLAEPMIPYEYRKVLIGDDTILRVESPDYDEMQTVIDNSKKDLFQELFERGHLRNSFILIEIADFCTPHRDQQFLSLLQSGLCENQAQLDYSLAKGSEESTRDQTQIQHISEEPSTIPMETDFFDPSLEQDITKISDRQQASVNGGFVRSKITGTIDRSNRDSMTALLQIDPVPDKDVETMLEYLKCHPAIANSENEQRKPRISVLRGYRTYSELPKFVVPNYTQSTQEYQEQLKIYLKITESTFPCLELFSSGKFQQISSVAPFDEHTSAFDEPRLLIASSNHIAVVCQTDGEIQLLKEPNVADDVPPTGLRTCKMVAGMVAVFRVDLPPVIYKVDSNWNLNTYFTSQFCFYGRTFSNSWNCTDRAVQILGDRLYFLGYEASADLQTHQARKYPEIKARLIVVDLSQTTIHESASAVTGLEDFLVDYSPGMSETEYILLRADGEVSRVNSKWAVIDRQRLALRNMDQINYWSALGRISNMLVAVGYINTKDKSGILYYLLDRQIQMAGGAALQIPLRKLGSIAPPVISTISKKILWRKANHQREEVHLLLAVLGSGEIHILGLKEKLFMLHKLTSNESLNYCAASMCQVGDYIYTGGQLYLKKIKISF